MTNRIIKFRAWDKKHREMKDASNLASFQDWFCPFSPNHEMARKQYELTQFTGLLDCNGKEIYEGDWVRTTDKDGLVYEGVVTWQQDSADYEIMAGLDFERAFGIEGDSHVIIGNIYENPDLTHTP